MPNPILIFAFVIATMYGLGFHVIMGGNARRMVLFIVTSWLGFLPAGIGFRNRAVNIRAYPHRRAGHSGFAALDHG